MKRDRTGASTTAASTVAVLLRALLERPGRYRDRWAQHQRRNRGTTVNQAAVAHVLAGHLWDTGAVAESDADLPRRLKDTVSRALSGRHLPPRTLRLFIEAFDIEPHDAQQLWGLLLDADPARLSVPHRAAGGGPPPPARPYRTVMLHEFHRVGADRIPTEHRTLQVVAATGPLERYRFRFDTAAAAVEVIRGGTVSPVMADELPGFFAVDITLATPIGVGETASFEYRTVFTYAEPPEPEVRRFALGRVENLEVHVSFDPRRRPRRLWWCHWDDYRDPEPRQRAPVALAPAGEAHRFVAVLEGEGVGFSWDW